VNSMAPRRPNSEQRAIGAMYGPNFDCLGFFGHFLDCTGCIVRGHSPLTVTQAAGT
jgi:hypothetical protein